MRISDAPPDSAAKPWLCTKLRALAILNRSHTAELRAAANALELAVHKAYSENGTEDDVKRMLGCWARARRLYCDITGEPLV